MLDGGGGRTQKDVYFPPSILVVRCGLKNFCLSSHFVSSAALVMTRGRHSGRDRDASAGSCQLPNNEWRHWLFKRSLDVVNWRQTSNLQNLLFAVVSETAEKPPAPEKVARFVAKTLLEKSPDLTRMSGRRQRCFSARSTWTGSYRKHLLEDRDPRTRRTSWD